jgi:AraC family transcriptional regulator of adaptative response/methylated-DNA-[protein]-cysteine methyltransferase
MQAMSRAESRAAEVQDDARWTAVRTRDGSADGRFVYAVATTGVFCRPSCGARTPRPENVSFFATPAAARGAGFRPCRRCRPEDPPLAERNAALVADVCRFLDAALEHDETATLDALAARAHVSPHHLHRTFKSVTGMTPRAYLAARRAARLRDGLTGSGSVTTAALDAGYGSLGRFYAGADDALGMTPRRFARGGELTGIRFAVGATTLGAILVAESDRGICAILLGDDADVLVRDLQDRFPRATLEGADPAFDQKVAQVVGLIEAPGTGLDLPLDVRGTAFQARVWDALRQIPPGTTWSYAEVAARLGAPSSTRAVAQACGANALAVAIPCHRVVRSDGALSGYRWGVERKRALLAREKRT